MNGRANSTKNMSGEFGIWVVVCADLENGKLKFENGRWDRNLHAGEWWRLWRFQRWRAQQAAPLRPEASR